MKRTRCTTPAKKKKVPRLYTVRWMRFAEWREEPMPGFTYFIWYIPYKELWAWQSYEKDEATQCKTKRLAVAACNKHWRELIAHALVEWPRP